MIGFNSWYQKYYSSLSSCQNASCPSWASSVIKLIHVLFAGWTICWTWPTESKGNHIFVIGFSFLINHRGNPTKHSEIICQWHVCVALWITVCSSIPKDKTQWKKHKVMQCCCYVKNLPVFHFEPWCQRKLPFWNNKDRMAHVHCEHESSVFKARVQPQGVPRTAMWCLIVCCLSPWADSLMSELNLICLVPV